MTAIVYSGTLRYFRQKSRRFTRSRWKGAIAWYCVLAIGGFFALNWIYQVFGNRVRSSLRSALPCQRARRPPGRVTDHSSRNIPPTLFHLNFLPPSLRSKVAAIPSLAPTGAGSGHGTLSTFIVRPQVRSACFKSPTEHSLRPESFASGIIRL